MAGFALGVWLVREGVANPWIRKYEWWRIRSEDRKRQAQQARADLAQAEAQKDQLMVELHQLDAQADQLRDYLDQAARYVTGETDTAIARRLLDERIALQRVGKRRGRRPRTPNGMSYEEAVDMGRKIRQFLANGMSWSNAAKRFDISVETARTRVQWADDEDSKQRDTA